MSEITLHTAQTSKSYSSKNRRFLGGTGVDNNYIYNIIFYAIYAIRHIFLCRNVGNAQTIHQLLNFINMTHKITPPKTAKINQNEVIASLRSALAQTTEH